MNFKNLATGAALALGIALVSSPAAHADVIYTYTGNDFTRFTGPYTGTDKVTATITLANPLGASLALTAVTPLAFTLSDGVQTLTDATPSLQDRFDFTTDSSGTIKYWLVDAQRNPAEYIKTDNPGPSFLRRDGHGWFSPPRMVRR
jgi:hypothetical protein